MFRISMKILFQNKKIIVAAILICIILQSFVAFQMMLISRKLTKLKTIPDFLFNGCIYSSQDGSYPFRAFYGTNQLVDKIEQSLKTDKGNVYRVVCRSLYNYYDEKTNIGFSGYVYGLPDAYIEQVFSDKIVMGRLPEKSKKEAVVGLYFANRFKLEIGDKIPQAITLHESWEDTDIDAYTISGILDDSISDLFVGSAIISLDTFENLNTKVQENMLFGDFKDVERDEALDLFLGFNEFAQDTQVPEGKFFLNQNRFELIKILTTCVFVIFAITVVLIVLVSYLVKGLSQKIGLMKAIGISEFKVLLMIMKIMTVLLVISTIISLGVVYLISLGINHYISGFYEFDVNVFSINIQTVVGVVSTAFVMMLFMYFSVSRSSRRIPPSLAIAF